MRQPPALKPDRFGESRLFGDHPELSVIALIIYTAYDDFRYGLARKWINAKGKLLIPPSSSPSKALNCSQAFPTPEEVKEGYDFLHKGDGQWLCEIANQIMGRELLNARALIRRAAYVAAGKLETDATVLNMRRANFLEIKQRARDTARAKEGKPMLAGPPDRRGMLAEKSYN